MARKKKKLPSNVIATNRKASYEYHLEDQYEAGLVLHGWEVKSIREGRANLKESYITAHRGEIFLVGSHISPSATTSTHVSAIPTRERKLLLHRIEINRLCAAVEQKGYTMVPLQLIWSNGKVKLKFALAKGKKRYDKRAALKLKDIARDQERDSVRFQRY